MTPKDTINVENLYMMEKLKIIKYMGKGYKQDKIINLMEFIKMAKGKMEIQNGSKYKKRDFQ